MTDNPEQPGRPRPLPFETPSPIDGRDAAASPRRHEVADDREHRLDPRSVTVSRLAGGIWAFALSSITLIPTLVISFANRFGAVGWLVMLGSWLAFAGLLAIFALSWPPVRYRHASYRVDDRGLQIRSGVVFRSVVSVPRSRVQHTDVSRGPIERNFGLATLIIHTAGTQHASVALGGLTESVADRIRDFLIEGGEDDAV